MNDESLLLYDKYMEGWERYIPTGSTGFNNRHFYSDKAKCFVYHACWMCENMIINELIQGMVYCKHNIKPESYNKCRSRIVWR
jgi:hypothetical protein